MFLFTMGWRVLRMAVTIAAFWFVLFAWGAVPAPRWDQAGAQARQVVAQVDAAWHGFSAGFYQQ